MSLPWTREEPWHERGKAVSETPRTLNPLCFDAKHLIEAMRIVFLVHTYTSSEAYHKEPQLWDKKHRFFFIN